MTNNDNWEDLEDLDELKDEDFSDAWEDIDDDFQDIEIDIPEPVSVSESLEEPKTTAEATPVRPIRKVSPKRDYEEEEIAEPEPKKNSGATILIIVLIAVIVGALIFLAIKLVGGAEETAESSATTETVEWLQDSDENIVSLIKNYYAARTLVDVYTLQELVDSSVTVDEASLTSETEVIEGYQDISCYITEGQNDGEWVVYVSYSIKFKNIATPAPGLVACYVKTDETGSLRLIPWENVQSDQTLYDFIASISDCEAIKNLAATVNTSYNNAIASDADLKAYIETISGTTAATEETTVATEAPEVNFTTEAPTTEAPATEATTTAAQSSDDFETCDTMMYITKDGVNVRKSPSTDGECISSVNAGDYIQIVAKGSDWYKVCLSDGTYGYIKKDFFSNDKPTS